MLRTPPQAPRAPRANAYVQRWVRTVRRECFDLILIYNPRHLLVTLGEYVTHYKRPPVSPRPRPTTTQRRRIPATGHRSHRRRRILNGLINEYSQAA
jgi:hypothetical protein